MGHSVQNIYFYSFTIVIYSLKSLKIKNHNGSFRVVDPRIERDAYDHEKDGILFHVASPKANSS